MPKQKNPNKTDTCRKEEAAVKDEGATGPSRQLMIETIPPHTSVTLKPRINKSEWTKDFVLHSRSFVITVLFASKLTTEGLRIKYFIAGILLLNGSL
jgi:hypothetical protein